jgi:hypothetical protein
MSKLPPVPPANRSKKGTGSAPRPRKGNMKEDAPKNLREQGEQGNIKQNTTNQGYQQDR